MPQTKGTHSAYCSAALSQQAQPREGIFDSGNAVCELLHVSTEFLAEGQRSGVLQVRSTNLDDLFESLRLRVHGIPQLSQSRDEVPADLEDCSDMHCSREGVIRALAHVNVVVWMHRLLGA